MLRREPPPVTRGRLAIHGHFYQPERRDPFSGRLPDDPCAAPFRELERADHGGVLPPERGARQPRPDQLRRRADARRRWLASEDPATLARIVAADHGVECRRAGLPPRDPPARLGARPRAPRSAGGCATSRSGSAARRPCLWLPETGGRPADAARDWPRQGVRATILAPWQASDAGPRDAPAAPGGRWAAAASMIVAFYDARALRGRLVPARGDGRRGPLRPRLGPARARRPRSTATARIGGRPARRSCSSPRTASCTAITSAGGTSSSHRLDRPGGGPRVRRGLPRRDARGARTRRRSRWHGSPTGRRGAATTASCAGRASARAPRTGAGRGRSAPRSSGWRRRRRRHRAPGPDLPGRGGVRRSPSRSTRGPPATPTSTSSSGLPRRRRSPPRALGVPAPATPRRAPARASSRPSAGGSRCSPRDGWYWDDPARPETQQVLRCAAWAARTVDRLAGTHLERAARGGPRPVRLAVPRDRRARPLPRGARRGRPARPEPGPESMNRRQGRRFIGARVGGEEGGGGCLAERRRAKVSTAPWSGACGSSRSKRESTPTSAAMASRTASPITEARMRRRNSIGFEASCRGGVPRLDIVN